ncbi:ROK family protein [Dethiosulfovibrio salsuginis]|uniref:Glucokinase n=1 Tax=Dethiosulfovibrio salsuginis TaxID=561720 RepID=A0A1X7KHM0_9BACT|nr:ROK family protein [Dethiosulfovibrio salsuginis]SMG40048.1 glucokinase [Dethiosulfovibrio salsuginis]
MRIGIDLGGHKIAGGKVEDGSILQRIKIPTPDSRYPKDTTDALERAVRELGTDEVRSVGIGLPGMLSVDRRSVIGLTNLPLWENYPLAEILEDRLSLPVYLENDANCAALGEMRFGQGTGLSDFVMLTLGTGIGGAIVSGGKLLMGHRGLAGELGHLALLHRKPCKCGGIGHGETLFSADRFDGRCAETKVASVPELWDLRKDVRQAQFWEEALEGLSCVIVSSIHCLDPQAIILSGGLSNLPGLVDELAPFIDLRLAKSFHPAPPVLISTLGGDGPVIGAAYLGSHSLR